MKDLNGKVAVVTGAGSGIGRATALALAEEGCQLAISDINEQELLVTQGLIEAYNVKVHAHNLNVADQNAVYEYADEVAAVFGKVNIVVNNAGVAINGSLENTSIEDFEWIMNINFWGMVYGSMAFLPHLKQSGEGHICNVSSMCSITAFAAVGAYSCSKFAIRAFSEALCTELAVEECGVGVTSIQPGLIKTNLVRGARIDNAILEAQGMDVEEFQANYKKQAFNTPETVAKAIVKSIKKNKLRALVGFDAHLVDWATRLFPVWFRKITAIVVRKGRAKNQKLAVSK